MLELKNVALNIGPEDEPQFLLQNINTFYAPGHFGAIIGPSGCGKSTLLKTIAGIHEATGGEIYSKGKNLEKEGDFEPSELGYVPQFSIAHDALTVRESVSTALRLRVRGLNREQRDLHIEKLLSKVGLDHIADRPNRVLSGGQKRRLSLALEMVSSPSYLLCDEVTSGLDPKSEDEIVQILHNLSRTDGRVVLSVTHSLVHLDLYDSVTVLYQGRLAYQGRADLLLHYFQVPSADELFPALAQHSPEHWEQTWTDHRKEYACHTDPSDDEVAAAQPEPPPVAGFFTQFFELLKRRWTLFFREAGQMWLQLSLLFIFPAVVVIFALDGLPQLLNLDMGLVTNPSEITTQIKNNIAATTHNNQTGALVSGLVMFQVVLLTLMGSNNSAREIVAERHIFEKEKLAGLSPLSYLASKVAFLAVLVSAQALWMTVFVAFICQLLGNLPLQILCLWLVTASMTLICLAISAWASTTEQASLISIYLVGFQLPLSGAVLTLPDWAGAISRPFISAYWSWSGYLQALPSEYFKVVENITATPLASTAFCVLVLLTHGGIGLLVAYLGCLRSQQD